MLERMRNIVVLCIEMRPGKESYTLRREQVVRLKTLRSRFGRLRANEVAIELVKQIPSPLQLLEE